MSGLFRFPNFFAKHDGYKVNSTNAVDGPELKGDCKSSAAADNQSVLLRDDHIILLAIDGLLALHASFKKWRSRRRTILALADLDERQLLDIGLTRDGASCNFPFKSPGDHKSYRALAELDETQLSNLSALGLQVRREIRHTIRDRVKK